MTKLENIDVISVADRVIRKDLGVNPGDEVLITADHGTDMEVVYALMGAALAVGAIPTIFIIPSTEGGIWFEGKKSGGYTTKPLLKALEAADVTINAPDTSHGPGRLLLKPEFKEIRENLAKKKRKGICLAEGKSTIDFFTRGPITEDPDEIEKRCNTILEALQKGEKIRVTSKLGTDVTMNIKGRKVVGGPHTMEEMLVPIEDTAEGVIVFDGAVAGIRSSTVPLRTVVKKGRYTEVTGGPEAAIVKGWFAEHENGDNLAEFGMGTSVVVRRTGDVQEEKKALGTVHFAMGDGVGHGGERYCEIHEDLVVYDPTVYVDEKKIMENGKLLI